MTRPRKTGAEGEYQTAVAGPATGDVAIELRQTGGEDMIDMLPASASPRDAEGIDRAHLHRLYALIYSRVGNRKAAERLTSAVIMTALRRFDATLPEHSLVA